jgi:membrane protein CcdC involved in cytochrome C biogenesis
MDTSSTPHPSTTGGGFLAALPGGVDIAIVIAVVVVVIAVRLYGEPVQARRLFLLPPIFLLVGAAAFAESAAAATGVDVVFLLAAVVLAVVTGWARGRSIALFAKDGHLWMRYRVLTLVLWIVLGGLRLGLDAVAAAAGAQVAADQSSLMLMLGVTLVVEAAVVIPRARRSGVPMLPITARTRRRSSMLRR